MMRYGAEEMEGKAYSAVTIQRMAHYLRGDFTRLAIAAVMVILSSLLTLAGPFLIKFAIDDGIAGARPEVLAIAAGAYPVTLFAIWLFTYVQVRIVSQIGQRLLGRLRLDLFIHLQRLSPEFFAKRQIGNLMSRVVNDIDVLSDAISVGVLQIFGDGLVLITICVAMLLLDPGLAVLVFLTFPMTYLAARIYGVRAQRILRKSREAEADVNAELQESVVGVRIAQSFAREDRNIAKFHEINNRNFDAMMRASVVSYVLTPTVEIFRGIAIGIIVVYGGWRAIEGDLTVGVIVAFLTYVNRFFEPIRELSRWFHLLQASMVAGDRVLELLDEPVTVADRPGAVEATRIDGRVEFDGASFEYIPDRPVLNGVSFVIEPGQMVALVGPTGAGKTTIASLLTRFYDVSSGRILVDGRDVRDYQQVSLRRHMAVVLQDPFLFSGTVRDNIVFGRPTATMAEVEVAARAVGADVFLAKLENGYDTEVEERGGRLSIGQRQQIAFARAIIADPRILILDEATANIDVQTELRLQSAVARVLEGRTSLVVAHRLSTVRRADLILVLEDGRITQRGRHDELISQPGLYRDLYSLQAQVA